MLKEKNCDLEERVEKHIYTFMYCNSLVSGLKYKERVDFNKKVTFDRKTKIS